MTPRFINRSELPILPRKQWTKNAHRTYGLSGRIRQEDQCTQGLCLSFFGDPGIGAWVRQDKMSGQFRDELVDAAIAALSRSCPELRVDWVTAVPSIRSQSLVPDFAKRLALRMGMPFVDAVQKILITAPQKEQRNSFHQAANLDGAFKVQSGQGGTVLLVDDMVDSGWTFAIIGALLRRSGADAVVPLALTSTRNRGDDDE